VFTNLGLSSHLWLYFYRSPFRINKRNVFVSLKLNIYIQKHNILFKVKGISVTKQLNVNKRETINIENVQNSNINFFFFKKKKLLISEDNQILC
jgi:hypothetical protein